MSDIIFPRPLSQGDTIAIISPATIVREEYVRGAADSLRAAGFNPIIAPHALGPSSGSYAASEQDRLNDLLASLQDTSVRAILCARGGYGCIHLIPHIPHRLLTSDPKWIIGFSDVSALHALCLSAGVASLHAPMAKHLANFPAGADTSCDASATEASSLLIKAITSSSPLTYESPSDPRSIPGSATGRIIGGNLAVLNGLASTPFDILAADRFPSTILFIEDISEKIYAVERMLTRLHLSGALSRISALIIGQFTDYNPDRNFPSVEEMIRFRLNQWGYDSIPVAYNYPVGHVDHNLPIIQGATATLTITPQTTTLTQAYE